MTGPASVFLSERVAPFCCESEASALAEAAPARNDVVGGLRRVTLSTSVLASPPILLAPASTAVVAGPARPVVVTSFLRLAPRRVFGALLEFPSSALIPRSGSA